MTRGGWWLLAAGVVLTGVAAVLLVVVPGRRAGVADAWLIGAAALAVLAATVAARRAAERTRPLLPARRSPPARRPAELERLERELALMRVSGLHARQVRLRLRWVAAARLAARHGVDLDADPVGAAALVGPAAWSLIDVGSASAARDEPPMDVGQLRAAIEALERT
jgi:hypothetical protein